MIKTDTHNNGRMQHVICDGKSILTHIEMIRSKIFCYGGSFPINRYSKRAQIKYVMTRTCGLMLRYRISTISIFLFVFRIKQSLHWLSYGITRSNRLNVMGKRVLLQLKWMKINSKIIDLSSYFGTSSFHFILTRTFRLLSKTNNSPTWQKRKYVFNFRSSTNHFCFANSITIVSLFYKFWLMPPLISQRANRSGEKERIVPNVLTDCISKKQKLHQLHIIIRPNRNLLPSKHANYLEIV